MRKYLFAIAAMFAAGPAMAADLPARPVYKAPPMVAPALSWTGAYIGVHVGAGWENTQTDYSYSSTTASAPPGFEDVFGPTGSVLTGGNAGPLNVGGASAVSSAIASGFLPTSLGDKAAGVFVYGGQIGYNQQYGQVVLGVEADITGFANGVKSTTYVAPPNGIITNTAVATAGLRWLGTVRARAGWAVDRALLYITGGWAYGQAVATTNGSGNDGAGTDTFIGSGSGFRSGYAVGGGLEYMLSRNVTVKGEYLYYDLGTATYAVAAADAFTAGEGLFINASQRFDGSIARLGMNYKFY